MSSAEVIYFSHHDHDAIRLEQVQMAVHASTEITTYNIALTYLAWCRDDRVLEEGHALPGRITSAALCTATRQPATVPSDHPNPYHG